MDATGYEMVLEPGNLVWTAVGYGAHGVMLALQLCLAAFLIGSGVAAWLRPELDSKWLRRLGAARIGATDSHGYEFQRILFGVLLLLPALIRAPWHVSFLASAAALALLTAMELSVPFAWKSTGRFLRVASLAAAAFTATFILWERNDAIALGAGVLTKMDAWRTHELEWQLANDVNSPKVGDVAPDFALADPTGTKTARLSDFRGKRPVALVFGSYT